MNHCAVAVRKTARSLTPSPSKSPCSGVSLPAPKGLSCRPRLERLIDHWAVAVRRKVARSAKPSAS
jgi:hypothetical protein